MSLIIHKKAYRDFLTLLNDLESHCQNSAEIADNAEITAIWSDLKQVFQEKIIPLTDEELEGEVASRWISLQTEIQREFRLLNTDWLFWASARQQGIKQARAKAVTERLRKLSKYCQLMLTSIDNS
jgi:hypothetical protein